MVARVCSSGAKVRRAAGGALDKQLDSVLLRQWGDLPHMLPDDAERGPAGSDNTYCRTVTDESFHQRDDRPEQVLTVVQEQQETERRKVRDQRIDQRFFRLLAQADGGRDRAGHGDRLGDHPERDEARLARECRLAGFGMRDCQARLVAAAWPDECQQRRVAIVADGIQGVELVGAFDQRRACDWQPSARGWCRRPHNCWAFPFSGCQSGISRVGDPGGQAYCG